MLRPPVSPYRSVRSTGLAVALFVGLANVASSQIPPLPEPAALPYGYCQRFNSLYTKIREQTIHPDSARAEFSRTMLGLHGSCTTNVNFPTDTADTDTPRLTLWFPLRGYTHRAIGGTRGEGYRDKGFDLFDYAVRGSHPAQDIFIHDRNQDNTDDQTGQPVDVLSMSEGLVMAIETGWTPGQEYRGGNWIWVYDPVRNGLFYYAHNQTVNVAMGDWVRPGQKIGEVGRTGFNAYKSRSPTHLHLMYLQLQANGLPIPKNTYLWLLTARRD